MKRDDLGVSPRGAGGMTRPALPPSEQGNSAGPPEPPLVPGHLGTPSTETCRAALAVLGVCELLGDEELARFAENRVRDLGISPEQLVAWGRRHAERTA